MFVTQGAYNASYKDSGPVGIASKKRGGPPNHKISKELKETVKALLREHYYDFGPTLASEKLLEIHGIRLGKETVRKLLIEADLWKTRTQRLKRAYQPRYRRECYGELIQIDGSEHAWFEKRAPKCSLLVFIDDATSRLMELQFVPEESTFSYFESTKRYLQNHGKPVAFYSDKLSVFRVNAKNAEGGDRITQFGRALKDLNIDINRFGKMPLNPRNAHRELLLHEKLEETFCWQEDRTLSHNLTFQYNKILYLIEDTPANRKIARKRVTVYDYPDGSIEVRYEGRPLPYSVLHDRLQRVGQGEVVENK